MDSRGRLVGPDLNRWVHTRFCQAVARVLICALLMADVPADRLAIALPAPSPSPDAPAVSTAARGYSGSGVSSC
jgi:hypothetical protein